MKNNPDSPVRLNPEQRALVQKNLGLVAEYLRRNAHIPPRPMSRCEYDDLFQEGTLGLMRAVVRFDPKRDQTFAAFAIKHIHGAVSRALAERFATVRVPAKKVKEASRQRRLRAIEHAKGNVRDPLGAPARTSSFTANLGEDDVLLRDPRSSGPIVARRLGDALRERYEHAVRAAAGRIRRRGRGRGDRGELINRLVDDRLLIPEEAERTPLRQIARELKCTAGRALTCERQIAELAATILRQDPVYARIRELAATDADSLRLEVDERIDKDLASREQRHFSQQMQRLSPEDQQTVLLRLVSEVCGSQRLLASMLFKALGHDLRARILMEFINGTDPSAAA